MFIALHTADQA